jgi:hypothetical protein
MSATMMSKTVAEQYEAATKRAEDKGIVIVAHGFRKADHVEFYVTSSSSGDAGHIVTVTDHLECDCPARVVCTHKAIVRERLKVEQSKRLAAMLDEQVLRAEVARREAARREAAVLTNNRAFSLWKSA